MKEMKTFFNKINNYSRTDLSEKPIQWPDKAERIETTAKELGQALQVFNKRLNACMCSDSHYDNVKRLRKMKETKYAEAMCQVSNQFTCSFLLNLAFRSLGDVGRALAEERFNYELMVDQIAAYFREVELTTLPTLAKHRKHLSRACADLRLVREKLRQLEAARPEASRQAELQTKKEECQRRVTEQERRVNELEKVNLNHLFSFDQECHSYAANLVSLLKQISEYHRKCLLILNEKIPAIEKDITDRNFSPVFECSLMQHLEETKREIAYPIEMCIQALNTEEALREEGLFRLTGTKMKVEVLKRALNGMTDEAEQELMSSDPHSVADILKQYLRSLPDPILKSALFFDWADAVKIDNLDARRIALQSCLTKLPQDHYINLKYLIGFFHRVSQYSGHNKMSARNLGIVLGPSLLWQRPTSVLTEIDGESEVAPDGEMLASVANEVVACLIEYAPRFFPDGDLMLGRLLPYSTVARRSSFSNISGTSRRSNVPDSPLFSNVHGTSNLGLRRWPGAGSSSAIYSTMRRPASLTPANQRWPAPERQRSWGHEQNRRYASMTSIDTRGSSQVGESVVLDISQPTDLRTRTMGRGNTPRFQRAASRESSVPRRMGMDGWRSNDFGRTETRRYTSQQEIHDNGIRVHAMPVNTPDVSSTRRASDSSVFKRAESVDAILRKRTERSVLQVQVNGVAEKGTFRDIPVEVKILPDKGETKL